MIKEKFMYVAHTMPKNKCSSFTTKGQPNNEEEIVGYLFYDEGRDSWYIVSSARKGIVSCFVSDIAIEVIPETIRPLIA